MHKMEQITRFKWKTLFPPAATLFKSSEILGVYLLPLQLDICLDQWMYSHLITSLTLKGLVKGISEWPFDLSFVLHLSNLVSTDQID